MDGIRKQKSTEGKSKKLRILTHFRFPVGGPKLITSLFASSYSFVYEEYALTEKGKKIKPILQELRKWGMEHA